MSRRVQFPSGGRRVAIVEASAGDDGRAERPTPEAIQAAFKRGHRAGRRTDPSAPETPAEADAKALAAAVVASAPRRRWGR